jgi:hypothetical protein
MLGFLVIERAAWLREVSRRSVENVDNEDFKIRIDERD